MAARKTPVDPKTAAVEALSSCLTAPSPRALFGTKSVPGFFSGSSAKVKEAAEVCIDLGWLEETGQTIGKGKSLKALYRLTPKAVQAVLDASPQVNVLEGIRNQIDILREEIEHRFSEQREEIIRWSQTVTTLTQGIEMASNTLDRLGDKYAPPNVEQILLGMQAVPQATQRSADWTETVVDMVAGKNAFNPITLAQLYNALRRDCDSLTIGQFHDGIRALRQTRRVRLLPHTGPMIELASEPTALFHNGEVMWYVCEE